MQAVQLRGFISTWIHFGWSSRMINVHSYDLKTIMYFKMSRIFSWSKTKENKHCKLCEWRERHFLWMECQFVFLMSLTKRLQLQVERILMKNCAFPKSKLDSVVCKRHQNIEVVSVTWRKTKKLLIIYPYALPILVGFPAIDCAAPLPPLVHLQWTAQTNGHAVTLRC